ncbi:sulfite exporter TauE/SafE family protein [Rubellimicrobium roseum]|uniref:Probable membrane transporter protein n=1 Tax=Rubellimicrobium roseum TaxID=687525 RepID=A0A5C4NHS4_9RHOB|nr:sulfite exporter TauE/SafE family protein [Rubellimicrobium roseum]TNC72586.1 sulfite exporter TauE/SafE family protein [Rubellimicrobium roseum]
METLTDLFVDVLPMLVALLAAGTVIGFLAGLFGIGGGAISVPVFYQAFGVIGLSDEVRMPLAVGTSLAVIIPTSFLSARAHLRRGTVDTALLRVWIVPVILGVVLGALIARIADPWVFKVVFVGVAGVNAAKLLLGGEGWRVRDSLPGKWALRAYGAITGVLSALMGIGGGAITNLILTLHGVPIHRAVSTGAGAGVLIAFPATLGYVYAGWGKPGLPLDATGYVSWLTFLATVPTTLVTTRLGVALAHRLSRRQLETAFGLFLLFVSARFLWDLL